MDPWPCGISKTYLKIRSSFQPCIVFLTMTEREHFPSSIGSNISVLISKGNFFGNFLTSFDHAEIHIGLNISEKYPRVTFLTNLAIFWPWRNKSIDQFLTIFWPFLTMTEQGHFPSNIFSNISGPMATIFRLRATS